MMSRLVLLTIVLCALCLMAGCGERGPKTVPVSGTVTFDGEPLPEGSLMFVPEDASLPPEGADIANGAFSMRAKPGKNRVEIRATRAPEGLVVDPTLPSKQGWEQYLPARYNAETELSAEVVDRGENHFEFHLKSAPP